MRPGRDIAAAATLLAALAYAPGAPAERAALIFDPEQGTVLFAEHANRPSYPATGRATPPLSRS
jgi:D-alanyl-D-alanine carboxypeptidase